MCSVEVHTISTSVDSPSHCWEPVDLKVKEMVLGGTSLIEEAVLLGISGRNVEDCSAFQKYSVGGIYIE